MPVLPVITDTFRISCSWTGLVAVHPVNVFHVRSATGTASTIGALLNTELNSHGSAMWNAVYSGLSLTSIQILPLDGVSTTFDQAISGSVTGTGSGGMLPGLAQVMSFHTAQRGSRGRGRMYIGPVGETQVTDGQMVSGTNSTTLAAWGAFSNAISAGSPATDLVVASYTHADAHDVINMRADTVCGIQSRRQNQLRV